jgi:cytochrome c-type biogenesis protein CcmH
MVSLIIAGSTLVAVAGLLLPLWRAGQSPTRSASVADLYRVQIAKIDADASRGLVTPADAEGAKAEAARRLLAASAEASDPNRPVWRYSVWLAVLASILFVPGFSIGLYALLGKPDLPDAPLAARLAAPPGKIELAAAVAKIEAHLKQNPDDARGYEVLAPIYLRLGRAQEAALAYTEIMRLRGATPTLRTKYGEALVYAGRGTVTPEARAAFDQALAENPAQLEARFFTGLAAEQDGDVARATEIWGKIAAEEPEDSPLGNALRAKIAALGAPVSPSGPPQAKAAAEIAALPQADRAKAIRGMVERLASRLSENGQDLEGWLRLVRAYTVLDEREKAQSAVIEAKRNFSGDAAAIARLDALARELDLEAKGAS